MSITAPDPEAQRHIVERLALRREQVVDDLKPRMAFDVVGFDRAEEAPLRRAGVWPSPLDVDTPRLMGVYTLRIR